MVPLTGTAATRGALTGYAMNFLTFILLYHHDYYSKKLFWFPFCLFYHYIKLSEGRAGGDGENFSIPDNKNVFDCVSCSCREYLIALSNAMILFASVADVKSCFLFVRLT